MFALTMAVADGPRKRMKLTKRTISGDEAAGPAPNADERLAAREARSGNRPV